MTRTVWGRLSRTETQSVIAENQVHSGVASHMFQINNKVVEMWIGDIVVKVAPDEVLRGLCPFRR